MNKRQISNETNCIKNENTCVCNQKNAPSTDFLSASNTSFLNGKKLGGGGVFSY